MSKDKEKLAVDIELENVTETTEAIKEIEETVEELSYETEAAAEVVEGTTEEISEDEEEVTEEELATGEDEETEEEAEAESDEEGEVEEAGDDEDAGDEEEAEETEDELEAALSLIQTLTEQVANLTNENVALKKNNRRLSNKLATEKEKKAKFLEETKNLSIEMLPNEEEVAKLKADEEAKAEEERNYKYGDGIADI